MAQIFISHSAKDEKPIQFLNRAFASSNVQAKYEEIEAIVHGNRTAEDIRKDIAVSNAIMVVLGPNAEKLKHTRDWVVWESGNAAAVNKDVWVLEALEDSLGLSIVIPKVRHYVSFNYEDSWLTYLRQIVVSYDDSHVLPTGIVGAGIGAAFGPGGAIIGSLAGLILAANRQAKPPGLPVTCLNCHSVYSIHVGTNQFRCPVCNSRVEFALPPAVQCG